MGTLFAAVSAAKRLVRQLRRRTEPDHAPTVLVVDDETSVREFLQRILEKAGCRTLLAKDGLEAISIAGGEPALDLLLTDLVMPEMNGDELARRLRLDKPDLPVLYLTGFSDRLFADRSYLPAGEAFLDKPCSVKGVLEAVALVSNGAVPAHASAA